MIGRSVVQRSFTGIALAHADQPHVRSHAVPLDTEIEGNLCRLGDDYTGEG
jgi:hypothetical protein